MELTLTWGAVLSQLPKTAKVVSNIASKHYGVRTASIFDASRDHGEQKHWDAWDEKWRCNVMRWYISMGDELSRSRKISFPFQRSFSSLLIPAELSYTADLKECGLEIQPVHPRERTVTKNCTLKADLNGVPRHLFKKKTRSLDGMPCLELRYNLLISIQSGPMVFSIEVDGKEYGSVEAIY